MKYSLYLLILLKRSLLFFPFYCFLLFLCIVPLRRLSYFGTLHLDEYIFPFLISLLLLFFSPQLFIRPPQPFCLVAFKLLLQKMVTRQQHFCTAQLSSLCKQSFSGSCGVGYKLACNVPDATPQCLGLITSW